MRRSKYLWTATIAVAAMTLTACGRGGGNDTGITDSTVKLGGSWVFSGPRAVVGDQAKAIEAYFAYVNAHGGVRMKDGKSRKISITVLDGAGDAARDASNVKRLVSQDHVFALFPNYGVGAMATRKIAADDKIPQPLVYGSEPALGLETKQYPFTTPWLMSGVTEGALWADYIKQRMPNARVAELYLNGDAGLSFINGFKEELKGSSVKIVAQQSYESTDTSVRTQVDKLSASHADVLLDVSPAGFVPPVLRQLAGGTWHPLHFLPSFASDTDAVLKPAGFANAAGVVAIHYQLDPSDLQVHDSPAMVQYRNILKEYAPGVDSSQSIVLEGFNEAQAVVKLLEDSEPTRDSFNQAMHTMHDMKLDWMAKGVTLSTGPGDGFPIESGRLQQFRNGSWHDLGGLLSFERKTSALATALGG